MAKRRTDNTMAKRRTYKQWTKEGETKHTYKTKDGVTRTSLKTGAEMLLSILFYSISFQIKMIGHH